MDPYQVLGVNRGDDKVLIKKKYLLLMLKYHPDKVGDQYIEKCKEITAAYAKIMKNEFDEDALIPKKFREMGFDRIPTVHDYVTRRLSSFRIITLMDIVKMLFFGDEEISNETIENF